MSRPTSRPFSLESSEAPSLESKPPVPKILQKPSGKHIRTRSTYNAENAAMFLAVIEKLIATNQAQIIRYTTTPFKPSTLHTKATDALLWLVENAPTQEQRDEYLTLKKRIRICREAEGVAFRFKRLGEMQLHGETLERDGKFSSETAQPLSTGNEWKEELVDWLNNAEITEPFRRAGLALSDDDKTWLVGLLQPLVANGVIVYSLKGEGALKELKVVK